MLNIIAIVTFLILLLLNKNKIHFNNNHKATAIICIYLLTVGLISSTVINSILIIMALLWNISKKRFDRRLLILIIINVMYLIFNTLYIFSKKSYDPKFNPYIGLVELLIYCVYILALHSVDFRDEEKKKIIEITSLFSIGVTVSCVFELLSKGNIYLSRMSSIFKNPNILGVYGAIIFALNFHSEVGFLKKRQKNVVVICSLILVLLSQSRVALLGIGMYLLVMFLTEKFSKKTKYIFIISFILIIALVLYKGQINDIYQNRVLTAFNKNDHSTIDRINLFYTAVDIFKSSPIIGTGIRSFSYEAAKMPYFFWSSQVHHPHNAFLELLQTLGVIGGFLQFCIICYFINFHNIKKNKNQVMAIVIMFIAIGLLNRLFNEYLTTMYLWTFICFLKKQRKEIYNEQI